MLFLKQASLLAALFAEALAAPTFTAGGSVLHEKRGAEPHQWTKRTKAHSTDILPMRIGLTQNNLENADQYIYEVAHPESPKYGSFFHDAQNESHTKRS